MKLRLAWLAVCIGLTACAPFGRNIHTDPAHPVPETVQWNGHTYKTFGYIQTVGKRIGTAPDSPVHPVRHYILYSVPGYSPQQVIAVEVDTPFGKYVKAEVQK